MGNVGPAQTLRSTSPAAGSTAASFCQIALTFSVSCRRKASTSSSPRRPTTWASGTTGTRTRCRQADYLEWTDTWVAAAARVLRPDGSLFLNVGAEAERPVDGARRRAGRALAPAAAEHHSLDQVDRDRARARPARPPGSTRDLAVGHYKPINSDRFLNDCHEFIFHFTPRGATRLDRLALGVPYQDQSNIARWRGGRRAACAAAATRGSSRTKRFSGATATGRTRRRSRRGCPSSACACTACRASSWRWIRSRASAARPSRARGSA